MGKRLRIDALARLSASLAGPAPYEPVLSSALALATRVEVEEVVLQAHLFVGYPATIEALAALRVLSKTPIHDDADKNGSSEPASVVEGPAAGPERAERVMAMVYRERTERVRAAMRSLHPDLEKWMVFDGYGRVLGRPGLSLRYRELCAVSLLAASGRSRQLHSHLFGAVNVGAEPTEVASALAIGLEGASDAWRTEAEELWRRVQDRIREVG